jgi:isopenicillin N synthase-like dioxygenase
MKKYVKPTVTRHALDAEIAQMFTDQGFFDLFDRKLQEARKSDPMITQKSVFELMNKKWFDLFERFRYSSYDSFRQCYNRKIKSKKLGNNVP